MGVKNWSCSWFSILKNWNSFKIRLQINFLVKSTLQNFSKDETFYFWSYFLWAILKIIFLCYLLTCFDLHLLPTSRNSLISREWLGWNKNFKTLYWMIITYRIMNLNKLNQIFFSILDLEWWICLTKQFLMLWKKFSKLWTPSWFHGMQWKWGHDSTWNRFQIFWRKTKYHSSLR